MLHEKIDIKCEGSEKNAALYTYILDASNEMRMNLRPIIIVCPGGGYAYTSDREAEIVAMQFVAMGYHAAVLRYSTAPAVYPTALLELGKTILTIRQNVEKWHVDTNKIVPIGFSAGGHLVASYCMFWQKEFVSKALDTESNKLKPNGMMLGYPVITAGEYAHHDSFHNLLQEKYEEKKQEVSLEYQVTEVVPRTFIWHTSEDSCVPVQNSILLVSALLEKKISTEFHMFEKGDHGLSLANKLTQNPDGFGEEANCQCWIELAHRWLEKL